MFLQWLAPTGKPDATYDIVESLLTMSYGAESCATPWQQPDVAVLGSMKVVRVTGVKRAGKHFHGILVKFLEHTARAGGSGPRWQGFEQTSMPVSSPTAASASVSDRRKWQLFAVIKDFGQNEPIKKLSVPISVLHKPISSRHPAFKQVSCCSCALHALLSGACKSTYFGAA